MPTRKTPIDLSEYLPDPETAKAMAQGPIEYNKNVDPKLRARLEELKRRGSSPSLPRVALPSVTVYVPPTEIPEAPRADAKVEIAVPPAPSEFPTQPSLRRLEGEPDLPGVVKSPRWASPVSVRTATLAVLAVLVPVVLVIIVMGRATQKPDLDRAASASTAASSATASPMPPTVASTAPAAVVTAAPAPSAEPSATPSAAPAAPTGAAHRPKPRATAHDDPYDAAPPPLVPTSAPSATAASSAPPAVPTTTGPSAPAQKPEF
jgi:hypothetical protein